MTAGTGEGDGPSLMAAGEQMYPAVMASGPGSHVAAWLHPETDARAVALSIASHTAMAVPAERGLFHMYFFIADTPAARDHQARSSTAACRST